MGVRQPMSEPPSTLAGTTTSVLRRMADAWSLLSHPEKTRAEQFRFSHDRDDFVAAHALARLCAGELLDTEPSSLTVRQVCESCGGAHGKPEIVEQPDLHV